MSLTTQLKKKQKKYPKKVEDIKIDCFNFEKKSNLFPFVFTYC